VHEIQSFQGEFRENNWATFFLGKIYVFIFTLNELACILGYFFTRSSGQPEYAVSLFVSDFSDKLPFVYLDYLSKLSFVYLGNLLDEGPRDAGLVILRAVLEHSQKKFLAELESTTKRSSFRAGGTRLERYL
jgi:hypothetical protein